MIKSCHKAFNFLTPTKDSGLSDARDNILTSQDQGSQPPADYKPRIPGCLTRDTSNITPNHLNRGTLSRRQR